MFRNWTRKLSGIAFCVVTVIALGISASWALKAYPPALADWSAFLEKLAWTYGIVIGLSAVKSVASTVAESRKPSQPTA